jgi:parvulin-like peptidyl-prolyl isomerase
VAHLCGAFVSMPAVRHRPSSRSKSAAVRLAALYPSRRQLRRWNRERRVHRFLIAGVACVVGIVAAILAFGYVRENVWRASETAATVNGETITVSQILDRVKPRAAALDAQAQFYQAQGLGQAAAQISLQRSNLPDQVLDSMIEEKLVAAEISRRGLAVSEDEVEASIRKEIAEQDALSNPPTPTPTVEASPTPLAGASPSPTLTPTTGPTSTSTAVPTLSTDRFDTAYQSFLQRANLTDSAYRDLKRADVSREKLRENIRTDIPRTDEMVHVRHIVVDNQDSLVQVQQKLAEGVPFDQVAKEHSTDAATRDKGGDMGWLPRGQQSAAFDAAAFSQPIGEIGQPIQTTGGNEIVQVLERDAAHALTPEQLEGKASQGYQVWYSGVRNGENVKNDLSPDERAWILRQVGPRPRGS